MKKSMAPIAWMCSPGAPFFPLHILVWRMVNLIRGFDLAVIQEDKYLQGYTSVQHVNLIPKRHHASLKNHFACFR